MAFYKFKMPLALFVPSLLAFPYLHHGEMHVLAYDKLVRALTVSVSKTPFLGDKEKWLMLLAPPTSSP